MIHKQHVKQPYMSITPSRAKWMLNSSYPRELLLLFLLPSSLIFVRLGTLNPGNLRLDAILDALV
jgi:hypothetical protein